MKIDASNNLIQLLASFSKEERRRFYDFLDSPFFNKRNDVRLLYKIFESRKSISRGISAERVIRKLFPEKYADTKLEINLNDYPRLRNTMTNLSKLAEQFLLQLGREKNDLLDGRLLVDEMMEHKLYSQARSVLRKSFKILNAKKQENRQYFLDEYRLNEAHFFLDIVVQNRSLENNISRVVTPFQHYYLANILVYCCGALNQSRVLNVKNELPFLDDLLVYLMKIQAQLPPFIQIYYNILLFLKEDQAHVYFEEVKRILAKEQAKLDLKEVRQILNFMLNFCSYRIQKGDAKYRRDRFEIYQQNLKSGVWNNDTYLSVHHFYLHVKNSIDIQELNLAQQFVVDYRQQLSPIHQGNMPLLCQALLHFARRDFEQSLSTLKSFSISEDFFYTLYAKTLFIKLFFEMGDWNELELALEALRIYLLPKRSRAIGKSIREAYQDFRLLIHKIYLNTDHPDFQERMVEIRDKIQGSPSLVEREWLLEKCKV